MPDLTAEQRTRVKQMADTLTHYAQEFNPDALALAYANMRALSPSSENAGLAGYALALAINPQLAALALA